MKKVIIALLLSIVNSQLSICQVGTWRNYLAYQEVQQIQAAGDYLFVRASNGLYQYNKNDQSIYTYDKTNGLNDTGIDKIRWCQQGKRLVVVYTNLNIDLVETDGSITNISDIYTKAITGDKSIYNITVSGLYAYLSCGFGIVKLNVKNAEISESYMFDYPVTAIAFDDSYIYAQTKGNGVWKGSLNNNLIDKSNWQQTNTYPSFAEDLTDYNENIELVNTLKPGGPKYNYFGFMKYKYGQLYTCSGSNLNGCIQVKNDDEWIIYQDTDMKAITGLNSYKNVRALDIDPNNHNHVFAGARNGVYEFLNGNLIKHYQQTNSPIEPFDGKSAEYQLVYGICCDNDNNLWCLNSQAPTKSLLKMNMSSYEWTSYDLPNVMIFSDSYGKNRSLAYLQGMMMDSKNYLWFVNDFWENQSIHQVHFDNAGNLVSKSFYTFINQNGSTFDISGGVHKVVEDRNHDLWVATSNGPLILKREDVDKDNPTFTQVVVPRNDGTDYGDYLLAGINITDIDIDGANRKWFGTQGNGVFLISSDNMSEIHHFTCANSPILSDNVQSIAINHDTGEVFIGTDNGLCSYMSDVSIPTDEMTKDNVWAYPNPVTPEYTGLITVTGLTLNADVKILSANGALIAEGRSNGGTFTWDGCDKNGNRVASGVYMVATATSSGQKGTVCKIAIVR